MKKIILSLVLWAANTQAEISINAGLSGTWHNNDTPGQGLVIDVIPSQNSLFAGWFTYLPDDQSTRSQHWFTVQGPYLGALAELTIYQTGNGQFNTPIPLEVEAVGFASLLFESCTSARLQYQLENWDISGEISLNRVSPDVSCQAIIDDTPPTQTLTKNYPPVVSNVDVAADEAVINIVFDLSDAEQDLMDLQFSVVGPNGSRYAIPSAYLSGHVGYPVLGGEQKTVQWDHLNDLGFQATGITELRIEVRADDRYVSTLQDIIDLVSEDRLVADVQALEGVRHYQTSPSGLTAARTYIKAQMDAHQTPFTEQSFVHLGSTGINIIGQLEATDPTFETYIIDGHYDTVGSTPGADDNASGTAGMLEAMRVLSQFNSKKHLKFIAFDKEELGLRGARFYAANINPNEQIKGLINFEMIGYTCTDQPECLNFPNADTSIYNISSSFTNTLSDAFVQIGATHVPALKIASTADDGDPNFRRSDHAPFWDIGVDALFLTDGANFRTPHYHQNSDRLNTLDTVFMTNVVKTAVGTLASLAEVTHTGSALSATLSVTLP